MIAQYTQKLLDLEQDWSAVVGLVLEGWLKLLLFRESLRGQVEQEFQQVGYY
jgi:hypothetical protein